MSSTARRRVQRVGVASLATVLLIGIAAGCSASSGNGTSAEPTSVRSGVGVVAEGCGLAASVGTGAIIDRGDGAAVVVTVAHTIKGATSVMVVDADGVELEARVVAFDKDADLAALDVGDLSNPSLDVVAGRVVVADGAEGSVLTWGPDDGVEEVPIVIVKRLRVTIEDIYIDEVIERTALEIAGPITGGDSGGPVLDAGGDVIGIVYANSRGRELVGFATDQQELADLLESVDGSTVDNGTCS